MASPDSTCYCTESPARRIATPFEIALAIVAMAIHLEFLQTVVVTAQNHSWAQVVCSCLRFSYKSHRPSYTSITTKADRAAIRSPSKCTPHPTRRPKTTTMPATIPGRITDAQLEPKSWSARHATQLSCGLLNT